MPGEMLVGGPEALAPCTVELRGLCWCGVSAETNPTQGRVPAPSFAIPRRVLAAPVAAGPSLSAERGLPGPLPCPQRGCRGSFPVPAGVPLPGRARPSPSRRLWHGRILRSRGSRALCADPACGRIPAGAPRGSLAPAGPPAHSPSPWLWPAAGSSRVVPAVRLCVGCGATYEGPPLWDRLPSCPLGSPAKGGPGWLPPSRPWGAASLRGGCGSGFGLLWAAPQ